MNFLTQLWRKLERQRRRVGKQVDTVDEHLITAHGFNVQSVANKFTECIKITIFFKKKVIKNQFYYLNLIFLLTIRYFLFKLLFKILIRFLHIILHSQCFDLSLVLLWRCWQGGRKGIGSVNKTFLSGEVLAWLSVWSKAQMICIWASWCHCHPIISCSSKIQVYLSGAGLPR